MTSPQPSQEKEKISAWTKKTKIGPYEVYNWPFILGGASLLALCIIVNVPSPEESAAIARREQLEAQRAERPFSEILAELCVPRNAQSFGMQSYGTIKEAMKSSLKAPSTAEFAGYSSLQSEVWLDKKTGDCMVQVQSYVDSQNSFGAMIRTKFVALFRMHKDKSPTELVKLTTL